MPWQELVGAMSPTGCRLDKWVTVPPAIAHGSVFMGVWLNLDYWQVWRTGNSACVAYAMQRERPLPRVMLVSNPATPNLIVYVRGWQGVVGGVVSAAGLGQ